MGDLALPGNRSFQRFLAGKIDLGFQLEFVMKTDESIFGFVTGIDEEWINVYDIGIEHDNWEDKTTKWSYNYYTLERAFFRYLRIDAISHVNETNFGDRHLTKDARDRLIHLSSGVRGRARNFTIRPDDIPNTRKDTE